MSLTYSVMRWKSIDSDGRKARISMCDPMGGEHFIVLDDVDGPKSYRQRLERAVNLIADDIEAGGDPGEIMMDEYEVAA